MVWNQMFAIILFLYLDTLSNSFCSFQFLYIPHQRTAPAVSLHKESPSTQPYLHPSEPQKIESCFLARAFWKAMPPIPRSLFSFYRSEEHTSGLQSRFDLVCRLLLEQ